MWWAYHVCLQHLGHWQDQVQWRSRLPLLICSGARLDAQWALIAQSQAPREYTCLETLWVFLNRGIKQIHLRHFWNRKNKTAHLLKNEVQICRLSQYRLKEFHSVVHGGDRSTKTPKLNCWKWWNRNMLTLWDQSRGLNHCLYQENWLYWSLLELLTCLVEWNVWI